MRVRKHGETNCVNDVLFDNYAVTGCSIQLLLIADLLADSFCGKIFTDGVRSLISQVL